MSKLIGPVEEVALENEAAAALLTEHVDLTELCRNHQIRGSLVWAVYFHVCHRDAQYMKNLLMGKVVALVKSIRSNPLANKEFFEVGHPYGKNPHKANKAKH